MSPVLVELRLRTLDDFFRTPDIDPFSDWFEPYSDRPAIEYVQDCVADRPSAEHVEIVVSVPEAMRHDGTADRLHDAVVKYCDARLITLDRASRRNNARGWLMLAFTIVVVGFFVWLAQRLSQSSHEMFSVAAEGLSIAAWVLLWHPLEALVFNRWDFRLDRRVLRTIRDRSSVRVLPLDSGTE
jgi:hypothetical protein